MFNGLIKEIAGVRSYQNNILSLKALHRPELGASVAVNGACLSVIKTHREGFDVELSKETRGLIAVENLKDRVHIEPALCYGDRVDGHLMQGHIDGVGVLEGIKKNENGMDFFINLPPHLMEFMAPKGSIGIDGVSLTINEILATGVRLTLIPITFNQTLFKDYQIGRRLNVESDLLARYLAAKFKPKGPSWQEVDKISYLY
ncbi:riboflavin synthase [Campylobacter sp.]|uniref:riboflavin synthase n=1 Tax=Campylobacter sp. TaxID=205 RepID=UPI0026DCEB7C|nr:riboflavin synthase [Campylobacter sp.]MDO4674112.1 riboflavin synthase [Campylobacter sp.]